MIMKMQFINQRLLAPALFGVTFGVGAMITGVALAQEQSWSYTYNSLGLKETEDGPRTDVEDVTSYTYDASGNLATVTLPLGYVTTYNSYDAAGRPLSITDASGLTTEFEYHPRGWLTKVTLKDRGGDVSKDRVTTYDYYADGEVKQIATPNGSELHFEYNGANHLTAIFNQAAERIEYELDAAGNRTRERILGADGAIVFSVEKAYDELSRLMDVLGNNGQSTHTDYDANDNPLQTTNALSHTNVQQYDALNRLKTHMDPMQAQTHFEYDASGNIRSVTDANGNTTFYTYDGLGNLLSLDSPDTGITTYEYDSAGNRIRQTDARGVVTQYQYDALNRLTHIIYPGSPGENVTYIYCAPSANCLPHQLQTIERADGLVQVFSYTPFNELSFTFGVYGGAYFGTFYEYDSHGDLVVQRQWDGAEVQYLRDAAGRISSVKFRSNSSAAWQVVVDQVNYLPFGPEQSYAYGNGLTHTLEYSQDYQINRIQVGGINPVLDYAYNYNPADNIVGIQNNLDANRNQSFVYDNASRLTNAQGIYGEIGYEYDLVGNRLKRVLDTPNLQATEHYGYNSGTNQLAYLIRVLVAGGYDKIRSYEYDEAGNPVVEQEANPSLENWTWVVTDSTYNHANRRVSAAKQGHFDAEYQYNTLGQRIAKKVGGVVTERYSYGSAGELLQVSNGQNIPLRQYIYLNGKLVGMHNAQENALYYVHHDHLGTPQKLTNQNQQVVWSADYLPFGEAAVTGTQEVYSRFPGQYYDEETGLYYNYFRDYDSSTGRYIQSDPIGLNGGINTYLYVNASPMRYSDPFGLNPVAGCAAGSWGGPLGCGIGAVVGTMVSAAIINAAVRHPTEEDKRELLEACGEVDEKDQCDPPEGTVCSVYHETGAPHKATDIDGNPLGKIVPHVHTYQMNKAPNGCFWNKRSSAIHTHNYTPIDARSCYEYPSWVAQYGG
jgi:RHS repeat-associated protein